MASSRSSWLPSAGMRTSIDTIPTALAGLVLPADVADAGRVVADQHGRQADGSPGGGQLGHPFGHVGKDRFRHRRARHEHGRQCWNCLSPVKTMARPCSSAAAMTSSSRTDPPGWITAATPAAATASRPSRKGKKASLAAAPPLARPAARAVAISPGVTRFC